MNLNCRWAQTRYGVFHRRTDHELFCRIEYLFYLAFPHGCAHVSDFDVLCRYREFQLFWGWQVKHAV